MIQLLILDVDGVLTSGDVTLSPDGDLSRTFHVQDGHAIKLWQRAGGKVAILSGRTSPMVERRAKELGVTPVEMGWARKIEGYERITRVLGMADEDVCVVGDDIPDLEPMSRAGLAVAVANAVPQVKRTAGFVTRRAGGSGAVAEIVEHLLRTAGRWSRIASESA